MHSGKWDPIPFSLIRRRDQGNDSERLSVSRISLSVHTVFFYWMLVPIKFRFKIVNTDSVITVDCLNGAGNLKN